MASAQISYGHSDGRVQNKEEFIHGGLTRKPTVKSLEFPELKIAVVGNAAIARHIYCPNPSSTARRRPPGSAPCQVWQKQDGGWKLLARSGVQTARITRGPALLSHSAENPGGPEAPVSSAVLFRV